MSSQTTRARDYSLDLVRILSIVAVIVIHSIATIVVQRPIDTPVWMLGNLLDSFARWAVPVFIIISGALLIKKSAFDDTKGFLKKKLFRIAIPIAAWPLIYVLWNCIYFSTPPNIKQIANEYMSGTPSPGHLYFLFIIAGLYALTPVISLYASSVSKKQFIISTTSILLLTTVWHLITSFAPGHEYRPNIITQCIPYIGYYMLGYTIKDWQVKNKWLPIGVFILSGVVLAAVSYVLITKYGIDKGLSFYSYQSLLVIIMSIAVYFILVDSYKWIARKLSKSHLSKFNHMLANLSAATFGVYLIHMIILHIIVRMFDFNLISFKSTIITFTLTLTLSYVVSYALNRTPIVRAIVK